MTATRLRNHEATKGIRHLREATIAIHRLREVMADTRLRAADHRVIARPRVQSRDTVLHHAQMAAHLHRVAEVEVREAVAVMNQGPLAPNSVSFVRQRKVSFLVGLEEQKRAIQIWIALF